jgi:hypothetical protein
VTYEERKKARNRQDRLDRPERARNWAKKYRQGERAKELQRQRAARYGKLNRLKRNAREYLRRAVSRGAIIKPAFCQSCRKIATLQAHHEDYSKPLEVKWFCKPCHLGLHTRPQG